MLLRHDRTPADPSEPGPRRPPRARNAVLVLVGAVVVGTGLGAAGVGMPAASAEQASGETVDLIDGAPGGEAASGPAGARSDAGSSSRSAARGAAADAAALQRVQEASEAARAGAQVAIDDAAAEAAAQAAAQQAAADAEAATAQAAADAEAERQRVADEKAATLAAALADPRAVGRAQAAQRGWSGEQFACLDRLWTKESGWTATADNPTSDAYGIPQSLPGSKMASAGADWATNPATQISWGLTYIRDVYGTPCSAWAHSQATSWY